MSQSTTRGERITAIVSAIVAIAILAAGVTAQQQHAAPRDELVQLESDFRFQLNMAFRHDLGEQKTRMAQLNQIVAAWLESPQSAADRKLLADWLLESTIRSMPGTVEDLPPMPTFGVVETPEPEKENIEPAPATNVPGEATAPTPAKSLSATNPHAIPSVKPQQTTKVSLLESPAIPATTSTPAQTVATEQVQVNLQELAARIAGYHVGLDEVETRLLTLEKADLEVLAKLVTELDGMARSFRFVKLYYDALTATEQKLVASPRSMQTTLEELQRQITRAEKAQQDDFLSDFDENRAEQTKQLRKQIAAISSRVDW